MAKKFAKAFYNSKQWESARTLALIRDGGLCRLCGKPAQEVHHVIHLTAENIGIPEIATDTDNLMCLCRDCHMNQHKFERLENCKRRDEAGEGFAFDENGMLVRC